MADITTQLDLDKASAAEINTGTDDEKYITPKGLNDSSYNVLPVASEIKVVISNFDGLLTAADDDTQKALETLDDSGASIAETDTGTATDQLITPAALQGSKANVRYLVFNMVAADTDAETGTNLTGEIEMQFAGTILQDDANKHLLKATVDTAGITGTMTIDINKNGATIMASNKISIDSTKKTSTDAGTTQPDLTVTTFVAGDVFSADIDAVHSGTVAKGGKAYVAVRET
jgi:hypothetical protein